jgi:hypothetical protein
MLFHCVRRSGHQTAENQVDVPIGHQPRLEVPPPAMRLNGHFRHSIHLLLLLLDNPGAEARDAGIHEHLQGQAIRS